MLLALEQVLCCCQIFTNDTLFSQLQMQKFKWVLRLSIFFAQCAILDGCLLSLFFRCTVIWFSVSFEVCRENIIKNSSSSSKTHKKRHLYCTFCVIGCNCWFVIHRIASWRHYGLCRWAFFVCRCYRLNFYNLLDSVFPFLLLVSHSLIQRDRFCLFSPLPTSP